MNISLVLLFLCTIDILHKRWHSHYLKKPRYATSPYILLSRRKY